MEQKKKKQLEEIIQYLEEQGRILFTVYLKEIIRELQKAYHEKEYYSVAMKRITKNYAKGLEDAVKEEVYFLKDIYTEEEIHKKYLEE